MGLYMKPVTTELGVGREQFSLAIAIANISWGLAAPVFGALSDRYGAGRVAVTGALSTAAGLYLTYLAHTPVQLYLAGVFLGLGVAGAGVGSMVGAVARAAPPQLRTQAIAALGMGSGIGMLLALPYTHILIEQLGWQTSLLVLSATAFLMLPLTAFVAGKPEPHAVGSASQSLMEALREAVRHPSFWLLNAGFFVCGFHVVFYATHLPAYIADKGIDGRVAVTALTAVGIGNLIGTYLAGQSARYFPKRYSLSAIYLGRAFVFLGFLYLPITPTMIVVMSGLLGLLWLSTVPLTSSLVGTFFGPQWMTMLYGVVFLSHQAGSFLGVWAGGRVFDGTKSYDLMWWFSVALGIFAALIHLPIRETAVVRPGLVPAQ